MTCEICKRNSCTRSFHSLDEQKRFDQRQEMSDDIDDLRLEIQELNDEIKDLRDAYQQLENECGF